MKRLLQLSIFGIAALASGAVMAEATFFANEGFSGRQFTADRGVPNLNAMGFNDRTQSIVVTGRSWEFCFDQNFGGQCVVLEAGRYPNLAGFSGQISSARPLGAGPAAAMQSAPGMTLFSGQNFAGRQLTTDRSLPDLGNMGFNDRPQSAILEGGAWQVCAGANFGGECTVLAAGRYPTLAAWGGRISSARPSQDQRGDAPREGMRGRASASLFSGPNLSGREFRLGGEGANTLEGQFNDRASSLRVDRGYWIFCSEENFRGECQTFGPGEYATLPPELNNRISSGRRISNSYPYQRQTNGR